MKNLIVILMVAFLGTMVVNANPVPFKYDQTMEFAKVDSAMQKDLLAYANAGKYNAPVSIQVDSIMLTTLVKGVKSRSGQIEDQIWLQVMEGGKTVNYLFSLKALPTIVSDPTTGKLTISGHRGDSKTMEEPVLARNDW
ncbi:hypothetical protein K9M48_01675 [Candidatus Gracilibacteria bacterium]|nr:hypothetical protein [Candidatus Gracilibacteria bacterium]